MSSGMRLCKLPILYSSLRRRTPLFDSTTPQGNIMCKLCMSLLITEVLGKLLPMLCGRSQSHLDYMCFVVVS
jgi:hypothetical protein